MEREIRLSPREDSLARNILARTNNLPTRCRSAFNNKRCCTRDIALIHFSISKQRERCILRIALEQPPGYKILALLLTFGNDKTGRATRSVPRLSSLTIRW